jgi:hypothetical protein
LSQITAERFDISELSFFIYGIESQRRFSATGNSCQRDHLIFGQLEIDVFEIVRPDSLEGDGIAYVRQLFLYGLLWHIVRITNN